MAIVHKTHEAEFDAGLNCILSDLTEDHYGDIVGDGAHPMLGWDTTNFKKNPIALWSHDSKSPIGTWKDVHVENGALRGRLHMAPKGSSPKIDELSALLAAGVLRGISVGFISGEYRPRDNGGRHFLRQTLVEASLVAVPANPSALLTAKALGVSKQTISMIFQPSEEQRLAQALKARDRALAEVKRIDDQIANEYSWAEQIRRRDEQTIASWTRHALKHRDPPKPTYDPDSAPYGTWRGVKLPGPTWRGKPVR